MVKPIARRAVAYGQRMKLIITRMTDADDFTGFSLRHERRYVLTPDSFPVYAPASYESRQPTSLPTKRQLFNAGQERRKSPGTPISIPSWLLEAMT